MAGGAWPGVRAVVATQAHGAHARGTWHDVNPRRHSREGVNPRSACAWAVWRLVGRWRARGVSVPKLSHVRSTLCAAGVPLQYSMQSKKSLTYFGAAPRDDTRQQYHSPLPTCQWRSRRRWTVNTVGLVTGNSGGVASSGARVHRKPASRRDLLDMRQYYRLYWSWVASVHAAHAVHASPGHPS